MSSIDDPAESIIFLRRFADIMSGGTNAAKLLQAAGTIENLGERLSAALDLAQREAERRTTYQSVCEAAESSVDQLVSEIAILKQRLANQQEEQERQEQTHTELANDNRRLSGLAARAEAELNARSNELSALQGRIEELTSSMLMVPEETMETAREQFRCLADEFERRGDTIATAMCEVGRILIEQVISEGRAAMDENPPGHPAPHSAEGTLPALPVRNTSV